VGGPESGGLEGERRPAHPPDQQSRSQDHEEAYPAALWTREREFLSARRGAPIEGDGPPRDAVGVALSGGGIRSATFCLGVFQALARHRLIGKIDYLSTVSGGGYFGSFFGALFTRPKIQAAADVEGLLDPRGNGAAATPGSEAVRLGLPNVLGWLRENGRYLSPNGSGDALMGGAVVVRNWVAIHVVLLMLALMGFLALQIVRAVLLPDVEAFLAGAVPDGEPPARPALWWSPFVALPLLPLLLVVIPSAWAYWMVAATKRRGLDNPLVGLILVELCALAAIVVPLVWPAPLSPLVWWLAYALIVEVLLVLVWWGGAWGLSLALARDNATGAAAGTADEGFVAAEERNVLTRSLMVGLLATAALLIIGLVDSIGQSIYLASSGSTLAQALSALVAALGGAAGLGQRVAVAFGGRAQGQRVKLPLAIVALAAAVVIIGLMLLSVNVLAHGIAWRFCAPAAAPTLSWPAPPAPGEISETCAERDTMLLGAATVAALLFSLAFGRTWPFLNQSSLHAMYSARLTRAYIGASNPDRARGEAQAVTRVRPGDNLRPEEYWRPPRPAAPPVPAPAPGRPATPPDLSPCQKGAPIHLINVTINETVDGRSQVQQRDRKGTGLAIGPCAFSVGVRHHAIFPSHEALRAGAPIAVAPTAATPHRVFDSIAAGRWQGGEPLTVGQWVGISGAAFSTGLGARTSLGLSLLCGFANVRLGYWWGSEVEPPAGSPGRSSWRRRVEWLFPLQTFLLKEFLSHFSGTAHTRWYLSDGGHFENMAGYELIRRRLPRMLVVDAEADPEYAFEGLANLVRKARLDFGAEIRFLGAGELDTAVARSHRRLFGSLEELRRGKWAREPIDDPRTSAPRLAIDQPVDQTRYSRAHAALARVTWADEPARGSWLLYLKPSISGGEPTDVIEYHRSHPAFPQETTGDQFFDEAQWESYRMLGFAIADAVLAPASDPAARAADELPAPQTLIFG
jgi:hypothetical protein